MKKTITFLLAGCLASLTLSAQEADTTVPSIEGHVKLSATALYYDAVKAKQNGDFDEAVTLFEKVIEIDPKAAGAYYDLAKLNYAQKRSSIAEKQIQKAISIDPSNRWYKEQYAVLLLSQNKFKKASSVYENIVALDTTNRNNKETLAYIYQRSGESKKALSVIDDLLRVYGDDEDLLEKKLQIYINDNQLDEAVALITRIIEKLPNESKYYVRLAEMYNNNNQKDKAATVYQDAEKKFPDDAGIQLSLSEYYKSKNDKANYKKYIKKVITNNSLEVSTQLSILQSFVIENSSNDDRMFAAEMAKELIKQSPNNANAVLALANMLAVTGDLKGAAEQYKRSLEIDKSNYQVWKNLVAVYSQELNADSIIKFTAKALRLFPNQSNMHFMNGVGHNLNKNYDKAVRSIERAIDMLPSENVGELANMHSTLGDVYNNKKDYKLSDEHYDKTLELDPDNATALNNYSYYLSVRGVRLNDAERMSKRSLELAPDLPTFLDTYGWILYQKGEFKKAKEYIQKAIDNEPAPSGTLWEHLGDVHYKLKNVDKAVECWEKAKELGTENANIEQKIKDRKLYES